MGTASRPALLVIAAEILDRGIATHCVEQRGLRAIFATDMTDAIDSLGSTVMAAIVVVPPLRDVDSFALAEALRRESPTTPVAIVLGGSRHLDHGARVLWTSRAPIASQVLAAVDDLGSESLSDWPELAWDGTTAEVAMDRLTA